MIDRVFVPIKDKALAWQGCLERNWKDECTKFSELEWVDLSNDSIRSQLNEYSFVCKIAEDAFVPCKENGVAGVCKQTFYKKWFLGRRYRKVLKFIRQDDVQAFRDGRSRCFSLKAYDFGSI